MSLTLIPRVRTSRGFNLRNVAGYAGNAGWPVGLPAHLIAARQRDRLFGDFFEAIGTTVKAQGAETPRGFVPKLAVSESDDGYTVSAELPGVKLEDLEIVLEDNVLTLKGHKKDGREDDEKTAAGRSEQQFGSFERRVTFRAPIADDEVKARYADGLLTISVPKPPEARPKVRTVPVETA